MTEKERIAQIIAKGDRQSLDDVLKSMPCACGKQPRAMDVVMVGDVEKIPCLTNPIAKVNSFRISCATRCNLCGHQQRIAAETHESKELSVLTSPAESPNPASAGLGITPQ
jgi:hypothetical protein